MNSNIEIKHENYKILHSKMLFKYLGILDGFTWYFFPLSFLDYLFLNEKKYML